MRYYSTSLKGVFYVRGYRRSKKSDLIKTCNLCEIHEDLFVKILQAIVDKAHYVNIAGRLDLFSAVLKAVLVHFARIHKGVE